MWRKVATLGPILSLALPAAAAAEEVPPLPSEPSEQRVPAAPQPEAPPSEVGPSASPEPDPEPAPEPEPVVPPPTEVQPKDVAPPPPPNPPKPAPETPASTPEDAGVERPRPDPWRDGHGFALEGMFGLASRIGSLNDGFGDEEHFDTAYQLGGFVALSSAWALGLELERAGLGRASSGSGLNSVSVDYDVTFAWLGVRVFPHRSDAVELFVNLRLGLGFQSLDASGIREQLPTTASPDVFMCSASDGPGLGLGATVGAAFPLGHRLSLVTRADAIGRRLSSDVIDGCAVGSGAVTNVHVLGGLQYVFDLGSNATLARAAGASRL